MSTLLWHRKFFDIDFLLVIFSLFEEISFFMPTVLVSANWPKLVGSECCQVVQIGDEFATIGKPYLVGSYHISQTELHNGRPFYIHENGKYFFSIAEDGRWEISKLGCKWSFPELNNFMSFKTLRFPHYVFYDF